MPPKRNGLAERDEMTAFRLFLRLHLDLFCDTVADVFSRIITHNAGHPPTAPAIKALRCLFT